MSEDEMVVWYHRSMDMGYGTPKTHGSWGWTGRPGLLQFMG